MRSLCGSQMNTVWVSVFSCVRLLDRVSRHIVRTEKCISRLRACSGLNLACGVCVFLNPNNNKPKTNTHTNTDDEDDGLRYFLSALWSRLDGFSIVAVYANTHTYVRDPLWNRIRAASRIHELCDNTTIHTWGSLYALVYEDIIRVATTYINIICVCNSSMWEPAYCISMDHCLCTHTQNCHIISSCVVCDAIVGGMFSLTTS